MAFLMYCFDFVFHVFASVLISSMNITTNRWEDVSRDAKKKKKFRKKNPSIC